MTRATSLSLGVAMVALLVPPDAPAQNANIRPANINRSANLKSGIFRGSGNFIQRNSRASFIGGGQSNRIFFGVPNAVIGGGFGNFVAGPFSVAGGGLRNFVTNNSRASSIGGGAFNVVNAPDDTLIPGFEGVAAATIAGGFSNTASARNTFVGGGSLNTAAGRGAVIGGGGFNNIETNTFNSVIAGGGDNSIRTGVSSSVIGGGVYNNIDASGAVIGGGGTNGAGGEGATVAGGGLNNAYGPFSAIGGGNRNDNYGASAVIGGGAGNSIATNSSGSVVGGGISNSVTATNANANLQAAATISGGFGNVASGVLSVIGGGSRNTNNGAFGVIPGGAGNLVTAQSSFAAGSTARATNANSFVWGDGTSPTVSTNDNTFTVRATGGAKFFSSPFTAAGPSIDPNGVDWKTSSDSNLKTDVTAVDYRAVLAKLAAMPVTSWQFKHDQSRRYIGPMAQDFHTVFGLGSSDTTIGTLDADGVLFSSVKGLVEELKERDKEIAELKKKSAEVDLLKKKLEMVEERLGLLPPSP